MRKLALAASLMCAACAPVAGTPNAARTVPVQSVTGETLSAQAALNAIRREAGREPVTQSDRLSRVARDHARDMAQSGFFAHQGSDGSSVGERARRAGYGYCAIAENIAKGQRSLDEVMRGWRNSPSHRRNMLSPKYTEFGLARAAGDLWVMVLARPGC